MLPTCDLPAGSRGNLDAGHLFNPVHHMTEAAAVLRPAFSRHPEVLAEGREGQGELQAARELHCNTDVFDHQIESERVIKFSTGDALAYMGLADPGHAGGDIQYIGHYIRVETELFSDRQAFGCGHKGHGRNEIVNTFHCMPCPQRPEVEYLLAHDLK